MRMTTGDNDLARAAAKGDAQAFRTLLERHYGLFYRVAYRVVGSAADAEDIAQEICCALPRKLKSFRGRSKFSSWAYQIALNAARDHLRREKTRTHREQDYAERREMAAADDAANAESAQWLEAALASLSPPLREAAALVLGEDMTHAQAARILKVKESTISWRMHEIKRKLTALTEETQELSQ